MQLSNTSSLPNGLYTLQINGGDGVVSKKVVKF
ncbi:MAG: T9SS type A sorting domain-containing protein [Flavisolibacter sp.]